MAKRVKLSQQYPETYAFAQELVSKIKRGVLKKKSVTKMATELIQPLEKFKNE